MMRFPSGEDVWQAMQLVVPAPAEAGGCRQAAQYVGLDGQAHREGRRLDVLRRPAYSIDDQRVAGRQTLGDLSSVLRPDAAFDRQRLSFAAPADIHDFIVDPGNDRSGWNYDGVGDLIQRDFDLAERTRNEISARIRDHRPRLHGPSSGVDH